MVGPLSCGPLNWGFVVGNDIVSSDPLSWSDVLEKFNIPKLVAGPAGEAISRLVGHAVDVPSEYVKNFKQQIVDKREARTEVSKALARAAASDVVADKELVHRAAQSFLAKELRAQTNKEAVAQQTIKHLSGLSDTNTESAEPPDDDWLNVFERYAENASSDRLRDLWARVLARQIRTPHNFSLRTLRFLSELDGNTALLFQKHSERVIDGECILTPKDLSGPILDDLMHLENAGLVSSVGGNFSRLYFDKSDNPPEKRVDIVFRFPKVTLHLNASRDYKLTLPNIPLTDVGRELLKIVDLPENREGISELVEFLPKQGLKRVAAGTLSPDGESLLNATILWEESKTQ
jgi:hypothetical protein